MILTHNDIVAVERELCSRSLIEFVKLAWPIIDPGQPYVHGWHADAICEHLEAVESGDIMRLLINVPPGTSKSTFSNVMFPAWLWGPKGKAQNRFIGAAHEQGLAVRDSLKTRRLIQSDWYQERWPTELTGDQNEKLYFENKATGFRQACAVTAMTGRRGDVITWDDPHSVESAHSTVKLDTATRIFKETLPTRLNNPDRSAIVVIMQRLHQNDVSGHILANETDYDHLCIPMEYEGKRKPTSIGWTDPRKEIGELLCPERFSQKVVDSYKVSMGSYGYAGQMQQAPAPAGGGIFKDEWWRYYRSLPKLMWRSIYADTAQKTKENNDYSVFQCWGKSHDGQAVLIDQLRGKWEAPELLVQARAFWNKHKAYPIQFGTLRSFKPEDKSSGTQLIQTLKREGIPIIGIPRNTDKVTRAMDVTPMIESGNVLLPEDAPYISEFIGEHSAFPNGANDDQVDPTIDAILDILGSNNNAPSVRSL